MKESDVKGDALKTLQLNFGLDIKPLICQMPLQGEAPSIIETS